uniref:RNA-dependent RNA polymerase n=1 Tax=Rhizoctonia cerealis zetahypovirus TaxID=3068673 RepID=A0AA51BSC0_9VIRU|nr:MAG: RNA-dependent RNA polymerase [Rhizoctonia cerealis zetahypovirus]
MDSHSPPGSASTPAGQKAFRKDVSPGSSATPRESKSPLPGSVGSPAVYSFTPRSCVTWVQTFGCGRKTKASFRGPVDRHMCEDSEVCPLSTIQCRAWHQDRAGFASLPIRPDFKPAPPATTASKTARLVKDGLQRFSSALHGAFIKPCSASSPATVAAAAASSPDAWFPGAPRPTNPMVNAARASRPSRPDSDEESEDPVAAAIAKGISRRRSSKPSAPTATSKVYGPFRVAGASSRDLAAEKESFIPRVRKALRLPPVFRRVEQLDKAAVVITASTARAAAYLTHGGRRMFAAGVKSFPSGASVNRPVSGGAIFTSSARATKVEINQNYSRLKGEIAASRMMRPRGGASARLTGGITGRSTAEIEAKERIALGLRPHPVQPWTEKARLEYEARLHRFNQSCRRAARAVYKSAKKVVAATTKHLPRPSFETAGDLCHSVKTGLGVACTQAPRILAKANRAAKRVPANLANNSTRTGEALGAAAGAIAGTAFVVKVAAAPLPYTTVPALPVLSATHAADVALGAIALTGITAGIVGSGMLAGAVAHAFVQGWSQETEVEVALVQQRAELELLASQDIEIPMVRLPAAGRTPPWTTISQHLAARGYNTPGPSSPHAARETTAGRSPTTTPPQWLDAFERIEQSIVRSHATLDRVQPTYNWHDEEDLFEEAPVVFTDATTDRITSQVPASGALINPDNAKVVRYAGIHPGKDEEWNRLYTLIRQTTAFPIASHMTNSQIRSIAQLTDNTEQKTMFQALADVNRDIRTAAIREDELQDDQGSSNSLDSDLVYFGCIAYYTGELAQSRRRRSHLIAEQPFNTLLNCLEFGWQLGYQLALVHLVSERGIPYQSFGIIKDGEDMPVGYWTEEGSARYQRHQILEIGWDAPLPDYERDRRPDLARHTIVAQSKRPVKYLGRKVIKKRLPPVYEDGFLVPQWAISYVPQYQHVLEVVQAEVSEGGEDDPSNPTNDTTASVQDKSASSEQSRALTPAERAAVRAVHFTSSVLRENAADALYDTKQHKGKAVERPKFVRFGSTTIESADFTTSAKPGRSAVRTPPLRGILRSATAPHKTPLARVRQGQSIVLEENETPAIEPEYRVRIPRSSGNLPGGSRMAGSTPHLVKTATGWFEYVSPPAVASGSGTPISATNTSYEGPLYRLAHQIDRNKAMLQYVKDPQGRANLAEDIESYIREYNTTFAKMAAECDALATHKTSMMKEAKHKSPKGATKKPGFGPWLAQLDVLSAAPGTRFGSLVIGARTCAARVIKPARVAVVKTLHPIYKSFFPLLDLGSAEPPSLASFKEALHELYSALRWTDDLVVLRDTKKAHTFPAADLRVALELAVHAWLLDYAAAKAAGTYVKSSRLNCQKRCEVALAKVLGFQRSRKLTTLHTGCWRRLAIAGLKLIHVDPNVDGGLCTDEAWIVERRQAELAGKFVDEMIKDAPAKLPLRDVKRRSNFFAVLWDDDLTYDVADEGCDDIQTTLPYAYNKVGLHSALTDEDDWVLVEYEHGPLKLVPLDVTYVPRPGHKVTIKQTIARCMAEVKKIKIFASQLRDAGQDITRQVHAPFMPRLTDSCVRAVCLSPVEGSPEKYDFEGALHEVTRRLIAYTRRPNVWYERKVAQAAVWQMLADSHESAYSATCSRPACHKLDSSVEEDLQCRLLRDRSVELAHLCVGNVRLFSRDARFISFIADRHNLQNMVSLGEGRHAIAKHLAARHTKYTDSGVQTARLPPVATQATPGLYDSSFSRFSFAAPSGKYTPDTPSYCYLTAFTPSMWDEVALSLGPLPRIHDLLESRWAPLIDDNAVDVWKFLGTEDPTRLHMTRAGTRPNARVVGVSHWRKLRQFRIGSQTPQGYTPPQVVSLQRENVKTGPDTSAHLFGERPYKLTSVQGAPHGKESIQNSKPKTTRPDTRSVEKSKAAIPLIDALAQALAPICSSVSFSFRDTITRVSRFLAPQLRDFALSITDLPRHRVDLIRRALWHLKEKFLESGLSSLDDRSPREIMLFFSLMARFQLGGLPDSPIFEYRTRARPKPAWAIMYGDKTPSTLATAHVRYPKSKDGPTKKMVLPDQTESYESVKRWHAEIVAPAVDEAVDVLMAREVVRRFNANPTVDILDTPYADLKRPFKDIWLEPHARRSPLYDDVPLGIDGLAFATPENVYESMKRYAPRDENSTLTKGESKAIAQAMYWRNPELYGHAQLYPGVPKKLIKQMHSSNGYPLLGIKGKSRKMDLKDHPDNPPGQPWNSYLSRLVRAGVETLSVDKSMPALFHVFPKSQVIKLDKVRLPGKLRTIVGVPVINQIRGRVINGDINDRRAPWDAPGKPGMPMTGSAFNKIYMDAEHRRFHYSLDGSKYDSTVMKAIIATSTELRKLGYAYHPDRDLIYAALDAVQSTVFSGHLVNLVAEVDSDLRHMWKYGGIATGHESVTEDNTQTLQICIIATLSRMWKIPPARVLERITLENVGDDNFLHVDVEIDEGEFISVAKGLTGVDFRFEDKGDEVTGVEFLSKTGYLMADDVRAELEAAGVDTSGLKYRVEHSKASLLMRYGTLRLDGHTKETVTHPDTRLPYFFQRAIGYLALTAHHKDAYDYIRKDIERLTNEEAERIHQEYADLKARRVSPATPRGYLSRSEQGRLNWRVQKVLSLPTKKGYILPSYEQVLRTFYAPLPADLSRKGLVSRNLVLWDSINTGAYVLDRRMRKVRRWVKTFDPEFWDLPDPAAPSDIPLRFNGVWRSTFEVENFIYWRALERGWDEHESLMSPNQEEFVDLCRQSPFYGQTDAVSYMTTHVPLVMQTINANNLTGSALHHFIKSRVVRYRFRIAVLSAVYSLLCTGVNTLPTGMTSIGPLAFDLVLQAQRRAFAWLSYSYWVDQGRGSHAISNLAPKDAYGAYKFVACKLVHTLLPQGIYIPDLFFGLLKWGPALEKVAEVYIWFSGLASRRIGNISMVPTAERSLTNNPWEGHTAETYAFLFSSDFHVYGNGRAVILDAPTGTGKTYFFPVASVLREEGFELPGRVEKFHVLTHLVVVPTRILAQETKWPKNKRYLTNWVRNARKASQNSGEHGDGVFREGDRTTRSLMVGTAGHCRAIWDEIAKCDTQSTVLQIDEYHFQEPDQLWLVSKALSAGFNVVISTATPTLAIDSRPYATFSPSLTRRHDILTANIRTSETWAFDALLQSSTARERGFADRVLIIHPSLVECRRIENAIKDRANMYADLTGKPFQISTIHAGDRRVPAEGHIVATQMVDAGVTIKGISAVIDSGLSIKNHLGTVQTIVSTPTVSIQRKGRTGRTNNGLYIKLRESSRAGEPITLPGVYELITDTAFWQTVYGDKYEFRSYFTPDPNPDQRTTFLKRLARCKSFIDHPLGHGVLRPDLALYTQILLMHTHTNEVDKMFRDTAEKYNSCVRGKPHEDVEHLVRNGRKPAVQASVFQRMYEEGDIEWHTHQGYQPGVPRQVGDEVGLFLHEDTYHGAHIGRKSPNYMLQKRPVANALEGILTGGRPSDIESAVPLPSMHDPDPLAPFGFTSFAPVDPENEGSPPDAHSSSDRVGEARHNPLRRLDADGNPMPPSFFIEENPAGHAHRSKNQESRSPSPVDVSEHAPIDVDVSLFVPLPVQSLEERFLLLTSGEFEPQPGLWFPWLSEGASEATVLFDE